MLTVRVPECPLSGELDFCFQPSGVIHSVKSYDSLRPWIQPVDATP